MAAGCTATLQQWLAAHWYLNSSSVGTDGSCCGECSPALAVTVTIDTLNPADSSCMADRKHLGKSPGDCGSGSDGHEERMGS